MKTLWGETVRRRRSKKRNVATHSSTTPYSITGSNDCEIIGHTLGFFDLAGCTTCLDCGANIFCPQCVPQHPTDPNAIAVPCPHHEESQVRNAI